MIDEGNEQVSVFDEPLVSLCDGGFEMDICGDGINDVIVVVCVIRLVLDGIGEDQGIPNR